MFLVVVKVAFSRWNKSRKSKVSQNCWGYKWTVDLRWLLISWQRRPTYKHQLVLMRDAGEIHYITTLQCLYSDFLTWKWCEQITLIGRFNVFFPLSSYHSYLQASATSSRGTTWSTSSSCSCTEIPETWVNAGGSMAQRGMSTAELFATGSFPASIEEPSAGHSVAEAFFDPKLWLWTLTKSQIWMDWLTDLSF